MLPGIPLSNPPITKIDQEQIDFCVKDKWDFVAASFIRNKNDIVLIREHIKDPMVKILAKIEDGQGVENIDEIIDVADGIIIARGDLGVEIPFLKKYQ